MVELRSSSSGISSSSSNDGRHRRSSSSSRISSSSSSSSDHIITSSSRISSLNGARSKTSSNSDSDSSSLRRSTGGGLQLNPMLRYFSFCLLFLAFSAQSGSAELVANYDNIEKQMKVFDDRVRKPLTLTCNTTETDRRLSWFRNGVEVSQDAQLKNRYEINYLTNSLVIAKPDELDAGNYTCTLPELNLSKDFRVVANVYFKNIPDNMAVVEGEKLTIHCIAFGTDPVISWEIDGKNYSEFNPNAKLSTDNKGIENAILTIDNAVLEDRAVYVCKAVNDAILYGNAKYEEAEEATYVRVKGKLAALWPFLGICAEVFILCAIILVYEKRRNKAEMDESDTDQSPEQEKLKEKK